MAGKLIIEIYEYTSDASEMPVFEYIPCDLSKCLKGKSATLKEIISRGFDDVPRKSQDMEKRQETIRKMEDANIGRINVVYRPARGDSDDCVELTNVVPVSMYDADARNAKNENDEIILKGKYQLSSGNEVTSLKDAQRLTLSYIDLGDDPDGGNPYEPGAFVSQKEICLNITYLQE